MKCYNYLTTKLATDPVIVALAKILKEKIETVNFDRKNEKLITKDMLAADEKRDEIYKSIYYILKSHSSYTPHNDLQKDITLLSSKFCETGISFLAGSYKSESTWLSTKIDILKDSQFAQAVEAVGLTPYIVDLENSQKEFIRLYEKRQDKKEHRPASINKVMPGLNKAIHSIEAYIDLKYDEPTYEACFEPFILVETPNKTTEVES